MLELSRRILSPKSALLVLIAACNLYLVHAVLMVLIVSEPYSTLEQALLWGTGLVGVALLAFGAAVAWESLGQMRSSEAALQESRAELRLFASGTPALLWTTDHRLNLLRVQGSRMPAESGGSVATGPGVGMPMAEFFELPHDAPMLEAQRQAVNGTGSSCTMTWRGRQWEGRVEPLRASDGEVVGTVTVALDVTEQRRVERELRDVRDQLHALIDASPLAIVVSTVEGRLEVWNAAAERLFGWNEGEVLGRRDPTILDRELADHHAMRDRMLDGESVTDVETVRVGKTGELDVSVSAAPVRDAHGAIRGIMWVIADISKRKAAEAERDRLEAQLRHAIRLEAVGRLAGGVAHDFNNLLTAIKGHSNLLLEDMPQNSSGREELEEIVRAADRATALTRQLLTFSRQQITEPTVVSLNSIVNDTRRMLARVIGEDVALDTVLEPELGWVRADVGQMEQVLMNLSVNARDAMPSGGDLVIATENVRITEDEAARHPYDVQTGEYVLLSVSDTGVGMDEATQASIFEPFFTTKPPGVGTGLGLSTVYGIVKQNRGYIWVDSEQGAGTVFRIYLPRVAKPALAEGAEGRTGERAAGVGGVQATVLVVEDEDVVRSLVRKVLERRGFTVLDAPTGTEALRVMEDPERVIDLLFTDVVMPDMNGRDVVEAARRLRPDLAVLYTSGYAETVIAHQGRLEDGIHFLEKPFTPAGLVAKVEEALQVEPGDPD
ncbi:MAG: PAS domain S-box protein [Gemmatimonadota bacterium]|jgi:two-component system, cell cycle sensor histidine kinase and response regulator CckA